MKNKKSVSVNKNEKLKKTSNYKKNSNEDQNSIFMKIFLIFFIIIFCLLIFGIVFMNETVVHVATTKNNIIGLLISVTVFPLLFLLINNICKENKKRFIIFFIISYIIFLSLQVIILINTRNYPGWDWQRVYDSALNYVKGNLDKVDLYYFSTFPNNKYLFVIEVLFFKILKLFGLLKHSLIALDFLNILFVNIAGVLTMLTIRKLFGEKSSVYGVILVIFSSAFYMHLPIIYSDTVAMPIPIAIIYTYLCMDRLNEKIIINKKNIVLITIMGFLITIGMKIKFTCIIAFLGIITDIIFNKRIKVNIKNLSFIFLSILSFLLLFRLVESRIEFFRNTKNGALPYTHWVMMGLFERPSLIEGKNFLGGYNADLYKYTFELGTKEQMIKGDIKKTVKKLKEYGLLGYIHYLYRKALYTWGDGTYSGSVLIAEKPIPKENIVQKILFENRTYYLYFYFLNVSFILFTYISIVIGAIYSLKEKKDLNNKIYITIFGLLVFLLIWEATSRYLVHYAPIILVGCVPGIQIITNILNEKISNLKNKVALKD